MAKKQRAGPPINDSPEHQLRLISESPHPATGCLEGGFSLLYFNSRRWHRKKKMLPIRCQAWQEAGHLLRLQLRLQE